MWFNLLAQAQDKMREVSIGEASLYALIGFGIVFLGISFLILVVWAIGKVLSMKQTGKVKEVPVKKESKAEIPQKETEDVDEETVAVIMAALMAYYQTDNPKCEFIVKRIKRI